MFNSQYKQIDFITFMLRISFDKVLDGCDGNKCVLKQWFVNFHKEVNCCFNPSPAELLDKNTTTELISVPTCT